MQPVHCDLQCLAVGLVGLAYEPVLTVAVLRGKQAVDAHIVLIQSVIPCQVFRVGSAL